MPIIPGNRQIIETPQLGVRRYGLFDAATVTNDLDARMVASGFQFATPDCGADILGYDANCEANPTKTFDTGLGYTGGDPYWLYAAQQCGTVGHTPAEIEESVRRTFLRDEQRAVEAAFWDGGPEVSPFLTGMTSTIVVPGAPGAGAAISALEEAFYSAYGYAGTIHINMQAYGALAYADLLYPSAGVLTTLMRSRWAIGAGYDIIGPGRVDPAAGFVWAFMTPQVYIKRGPLNVPDIRQTIDRATNQYNALAERVYAHAIACDIVFAVQVPIAAPAVATTPAVP